MSANPRMSPLPLRDHTYYPDSDGKPMGETPTHILNIRYATEPVENWFAEDDNVFIGANMFVYFVRGNPRRHVSPDLFVVKGVPKETEPRRRSYRTWEENGKGPDFITEFTSKSTRREDTVTKKAIYRDELKVQEYFLFDPYEEYLHPRLQGFRLDVDGNYLQIEMVDGRLPSAVLGLHLEGDGELLRFVNPATGERLPIPPEIREALEQAEAARTQAEAENKRLKREIEKLKRQLPPSA